MNILDTIIQKTEGWKTYAIAGLMIALGLLTEDQNLMLEGLGLLFLRKGVEKLER